MENATLKECSRNPQRQRLPPARDILIQCLPCLACQAALEYLEYGRDKLDQYNEQVRGVVPYSGSSCGQSLFSTFIGTALSRPCLGVCKTLNPITEARCPLTYTGPQGANHRYQPRKCYNPQCYCRPWQIDCSRRFREKKKKKAARLTYRAHPLYVLLDIVWYWRVPG